MIFEPTPLDGVMRIRYAPLRDDRGYFARTFDRAAFEQCGLNAEFPEHSVAVNAQAGSVRGLHFQAAPHGEVKVIRCVRGRVYDVVVDVRRGSPAFGRWEAFDLAEGDLQALYVPVGFAHGYQTISDWSELQYLISTPYRADASRGIRFDDPSLRIPWPLDVSIVSARDRALPGIAACEYVHEEGRLT